MKRMINNNSRDYIKNLEKSIEYDTENEAVKINTVTIIDDDIEATGDIKAAQFKGLVAEFPKQDIVSGTSVVATQETIDWFNNNFYAFMYKWPEMADYKTPARRYRYNTGQHPQDTICLEFYDLVLNQEETELECYQIESFLLHYDGNNVMYSYTYVNTDN